MELGKSKGEPNPRLVKVTRRTARVNFEDVYGISPEKLRATGIDPAKYAQEHSVGNPAFDRVMAASRSTTVAVSRPRRRLSSYWFLRGVFGGIFVVGIGTAGFVLPLTGPSLRGAGTISATPGSIWRLFSGTRRLCGGPGGAGAGIADRVVAALRGRAGDNSLSRDHASSSLLTSGRRSPTRRRYLLSHPN